MGKKGNKAKPKQDAAPAETKIVEPVPPTTAPACLGDAKLQRQREKEARDAKEEEARKKAQAEREKQEAKNARQKKSGNKATKSRSQISTPTKEEPKLKTVSKPVFENYSDVTCNTSGEWNVESSTGKMELDNSYQESTPRRNSIKLNRGFNNYDSTDNETSPQKNQKAFCTQNSSYEQNERRAYYSTSQNEVQSSPDETQRSMPRNTQYDQRRSLDEYGWRNNRTKDSNERVATPNYNTRDSFSKFSKSYNWNQPISRLSNSSSYDGQEDELFQEFLKLSKNRHPINHNKLTEQRGDLFTASEDYSLAHCVAEDMSMGAGIAKTFRSKFGKVGDLLNQRQTKGGLAILQDKSRFLYYLVTKYMSRGKPTYYSLWKSLLKMRDHIRKNNVTKLAIPQIGCGLDRLEWYIVSQMLEHVFKDTDIEIVVYIWDETLEEANPKKLMKKCVVVHEPKKLSEMQSDTGLLYFGSVDGYETEEFKYLASEFNLLSYKRPKVLADVLRNAERQDYYVYGLIIRNKYDDQPDFEIIDKALRTLRNMLKSDNTYWVGFQAFKDKQDPLLQEKLIALMQYIFVDVEIWVCWPEHLQNQCPQQRKTFY